MARLGALERDEATWPALVGALGRSVAARSPTLVRFLDVAHARGLIGAAPPASAAGATAAERARAASVVDGLTYALFLQRATRCVVDAGDQSATRQLADHLARLARSDAVGRDWRRLLSPFEGAKLDTISLALGRLARAREARAIEPEFAHIGLPANILEATLADALGGRVPNARAGCALAAARPNGGRARTYARVHGGARPVLLSLIHI